MKYFIHIVSFQCAVRKKFSSWYLSLDLPLLEKVLRQWEQRLQRENMCCTCMLQMLVFDDSISWAKWHHKASSPIVCLFSRWPIRPPALPLTHPALSQSDMEVQSKHNISLFPLATALASHQLWSVTLACSVNLISVHVPGRVKHSSVYNWEEN